MKKVFLAEDDEYVSRMYERAFRLHGDEVEIAHDGEEALRMLTTMDPLPSVVILDLMIPKKSGLDVLKELRSNVVFDSIPIAILTNSIRPEESEKYIALGADVYWVKMDIQSKDIVVLVDKLINSGRNKPQKT